MALSLDFETFSEADLKVTGADAYARHPSTELLCASYADTETDEASALWLPGQPCPPRVAAAILSGEDIVAWNAPFELAILRHVAGPKYGWPVPDPAQMHCTAATAANMSLPRDLDGAGIALGAVQQKDPTGKRIMLKLSRPRKPTKTDARTRWTPQMAPVDFGHLYRYCRQDVRTERGIRSRLYALSDTERELYLLDQRMAADDQDSLLAPSPGLLASAVAVIPNDDEAYDSWIGVGIAIKAAGGDHELWPAGPAPCLRAS